MKYEVEVSYYSLRGGTKQVKAETAREALDKLRKLISYGPKSIEDWMEKTEVSHPYIDTTSEDAFLVSLINYGYVLIAQDDWKQ